MGNLQHTSYRFSFVDVTLQVDALFDVIHSAKNWRSRRCTSHAWRSALIVQCTGTVLYRTLPENFGVRFSWWDSSPGSSLSASRFGMAIWKDWKWKLSHQKWCIRAGIEPNATIGQLVKMWTPTGCGATNIWHKKAHAQSVAGEYDAHTNAWDRK